MQNFKTRKKCPVCGYEESKILLNIPFTSIEIKKYFDRLYAKFSYPKKNIEYELLEGFNYIICECNNCQLIFQKEIANDFIMFKIYEEWTEISHNKKLNLKSHTPEYVIKHANEIFHLTSLYNNKNAFEFKVLDFGLGWSQWGKMAIAYGLDVYGHEISTAKNAYAKEFGIKMLDWDDLANYKFDFINTEQVFEHLPDPIDTLKYLKTCLNKDGILKISVPNSKGLKKYLKNNLNWEKLSDNDVFNSIAPLQHINAFNSKNLRNMALNNGFKILPNEKKPYLKIMKKSNINIVNFIYQQIIFFIFSLYSTISNKVCPLNTYILIKQNNDTEK